MTLFKHFYAVAWKESEQYPSSTELIYPFIVDPLSRTPNTLQYMYIFPLNYDANNTKWCNGFYIEFRQNLAKETFSYDEHLKS